MTIFGVPTQALFGQLLLGLINGAFYAMLSLGLSVIFGLLNIINFAHGAQYMMGAFVAYFLLQWAGLGYWSALLVAPIVVGVIGIVLERTMIRRLYQLDHLYGLLLTFGLALIIQGMFRNQYGSSGLPYSIPAQLTGGLLEPIAIPGPIGAASAVKMAYPGWNKGSQALLMAVRALAMHEGVDEVLFAEWARSQPELPARSEAAVKGTARKAWRFVGEMEEIAATFDAAGLPDGFHRASADVYGRLSAWKDTPAPPSVAEVTKELIRR